MNFLDLVKIRQSSRSFLDKPVERDIVERCIEAARLAPSACNVQPWEFVILDEPEVRCAVARATYGMLASFNHFTLEAPVMVLVLARPQNVAAKLGGFLRSVPYYLLDIGAAAEHFCLQAAEEGVGTCMLGWLHDRTVRKVLKIPQGRKIVMAIAMGYPKDTAIRDKKRKETSQIVSFNRYPPGQSWR